MMVEETKQACLACLLSLNDVLETKDGPARILSLAIEDGEIRIGMTFLHTGVTPDNKATLVVHPMTRVEIAPFKPWGNP